MENAWMIGVIDSSTVKRLRSSGSADNPQETLKLREDKEEREAPYVGLRSGQGHHTYGKCSDRRYNSIEELRRGAGKDIKRLGRHLGWKLLQRGCTGPD